MDISSQVHLVMSQDEAQTVAAYLRLYSGPGKMIPVIRDRLMVEIEAGLDQELVGVDEL